MKHRAIMIGGGVGGLCAAIHLAAKGVQVTLLERNPRVGGKLNLWVAPHPSRPTDRPYVFDTGPSILTLPLVFQDLFTSAGEDVRDYLPIQRLDPIARYVWRDGATFDLRADDDARSREVARFAPRDLPGFQRLLRRGQRIWDLSADFLSHSPEQLLRPGAFSPLGALQMLTVPFRIGMFSNFAAVIDRQISSIRLRQVLYQYATYSGASPFRAPATLAVIPFVEMCFGAWYIPGGMYKLAEALERVARKLGVEIRNNCSVKRIIVQMHGRGAHATGVELVDSTLMQADSVIANSDVVYTYRELIEPRFRRKYSNAILDKIEPGGSGMVLMLGVEGTYPHLAHHTKFMGDDYADEVRAIFETHTVPEDPCIYVCAATRSDPSQAPEGCESLFVLASAPALDGTIDWNIEGPRYRDRLVTTLESRHGLTDLSKRIVVQRMLTPMDLQTLYNANAGSIYGIGGNSLRSAFLRPPNRDRHIRGLYFAGGATHPGGGLPLVALSGKIVSELVCQDLKISSTQRRRFRRW